MSPKEKAKELVDKMYMQSTSRYDAKQCALIAVDEIMCELSDENLYSHSNYIFWQEVKQEIEKL